MEKDNTVKQAGGFIIQLMPFTDEKVIEALEKKISEVQSVTSMLNLGMTPEDILNELLGEFHPEISEKIPAEFHCDCSKKRVEKVLISLGKKELTSIINDGKPVELKCHFCKSGYTFTTEELKEILKKSR